MVMGSVDLVATRKNQERMKKKEKVASRFLNYKETKSKSNTVSSNGSESREISIKSCVNDTEMIPEKYEASTSQKNIVRQMRVSLPSLALACERTGVERNKKYVIPNGRKDKTLVLEVKGNRSHRKTKTEEHYVLVKEPGSEYMGHVTPLSGSAANIKLCIVSYLEKHKIDKTKILVIGCDGTAVNTGHKGGVLRLLEEYCGGPLQWLICQLHGNEIPLRHLFQHLDGLTTGPPEFSGPIGKKLSECDKLQVINVESDLPVDVDETELSTDQKYLLQICRAVVSGNVSDSVARRDPGKVSHSRWLTKANRLLRLYIGVSIRESGNSKKWILWSSRKYSFNDVMCRAKHINELALRRILKARAKPRLPEKIMQFKIPPLNFEAETYIDLISWENCNVTEPPLTFEYSNNELKYMVIHGCIKEDDKETLEILECFHGSILEFPKFSCHTQAVERCVKLVTEASSAVCGQNDRDMGYFVIKIAH
ncbi:unnamed protein product [Brassicogethes aeneus]|uniref:Uncharacterized protein n=1 Tax=Brassicogethes aeneus TaxID=1431903 RepID=A0A9P0FFY7_BRAAE|nr:unnamed protein product [Brassicogethes aeneus]